MVTSQNTPFLQSRAKLQSLFLVEEITHRVLNEYAETIATLRLALTRTPGGPYEMTLKSAVAQLHAHAEAHRALQPPVGRGQTNLADYIAQLCGCLTKAHLTDREVWLQLVADEVWMDAEVCWRVGLILAELIRNATKHGLAEGPGAIRVEISEDSGRISCRVCNDGRRRSEIGAGQGHQLVQALAAELGGSVDWTFGPAGGCRAWLEFPRPYETGDPAFARPTNPPQADPGLRAL
jgi:two-component sensor histidine kinase